MHASLGIKAARRQRQAQPGDVCNPYRRSSGGGGSASSQSIQKPMAQRLMDLMQLLEDGLINQEEFDTQRAEIISSV